MASADSPHHDHDRGHSHNPAAARPKAPLLVLNSAAGNNKPGRATAHATNTAKLPPLPLGVTELKFNDFFVKPVGPRGLDLTDKLRSLDGQRVRILGYMAHRDAQPRGTFLLTPFPVEIHDHDNSLAEDMPASVVEVRVAHLEDERIPFAPGLMLLTGTLSVGNRTAADGRVSMVQLDLDPPGKYPSPRTFTSAQTTKGAQALRRPSTARSSSSPGMTSPSQRVAPTH